MSQPRRVAGALALAALTALAQTKTGAAPQKGKTMNAIYSTSLLHTETTEIRLQPLRRGAHIPAAPPAPTGPAAYICPYANTLQNSRARSLPRGKWSLRWKSAVLDGYTPRFVLHAGPYTVVQAAAWQIFDSQGKRVADGRSGPGQTFLDQSVGLIYGIDRNGFLEASQLGDGKRRFITQPALGSEAAFSLVQRMGSQLLLAGFTLPAMDFEALDPSQRGADKAPVSAGLEAIRMGSSVKIESGGLLSGADEITLSLETDRLVAASAGNSLAIAVPGGVIFADPALKVAAAYETAGQPASISLDETGRAYLILDAAAGPQLWQITPAGELGFTFALPLGAGKHTAPAAIGYDHRIFVQAGSLLYALGPDGKEIWKRGLSGAGGGLVVTPEGDLLVSDGLRLARYDAKGERTVLFDFEGKRLTTPPVITEEGDILVASEEALYCLKP